MSEAADPIVVDVIINTYMNNPDLYDKSDAKYINKTEKQGKLEKIADYLQEMEKYVTVPQIIKIWNDLVEQFKKCLSTEQNLTTGSAPNENKFPYFEDMLFLKSALQHATSLSSITSQVDHKLNKKRHSEVPSSAASSSACPEWDLFAKKKMKVMKKQDDDVAEVTNEMLKTLKVMQQKFNSENTSLSYTNIIKQALKKVPVGFEDDCLMHVLNDLESFDNPATEN